MRQILPTMWPQIPMFDWLNYNICPYMVKYYINFSCPVIHKNFYFFWKNFFWIITLAFNIINDVDNDNANYLRLEIANHLRLGSRLWFWSGFAYYSEAKSFIHWTFDISQPTFDIWQYAAFVSSTMPSPTITITASEIKLLIVFQAKDNGFLKKWNVYFLNVIHFLFYNLLFVK